MIFIRALWAAFWVSSLALAQTNKTIQRLGAKTVEPDINKQTGDWKPDSRCRLLAHESIVVNSQGKDLLIFDGGLAKFRHNWNGENIEVLELSEFHFSPVLTSQSLTQIEIPELFSSTSANPSPLGISFQSPNQRNHRGFQWSTASASGKDQIRIGL
ncbi:unnamed protein product [Tuber aestivum]|uniref:Uncharacterized protein n=1 Tax=Tuber aestivum TaxID=59557 RepID=A0A292PY00_9PEZI|nr:unnamed protein product [Tuber aestivum]